jgi:hypothetical protein
VAGRARIEANSKAKSRRRITDLLDKLNRNCRTDPMLGGIIADKVSVHPPPLSTEDVSMGK